MRMWMVDPKIMCRKHLLGCHVESHMFVGTLRKGCKVDGYLNKNLFEPLSLKSYHDDMVQEMIRRGYNHKTPLTEEDFCEIQKLTNEQQNITVNVETSLTDLLTRCEECRENYANMVVEEKEKHN